MYINHQHTCSFLATLRYINALNNNNNQQRHCVMTMNTLKLRYFNCHKLTQSIHIKIAH